MQRDEPWEIPTSEARGVMTPYLEQLGFAPNDIAAFLENLEQATSSLLVEQEAGVWSFAHFTFQEYLCAAHWQKTGKTAGWQNADWQPYITEGRWHGTNIS